MSIIPEVPAIILRALANRWSQMAEQLRDEEEQSLIHGEMLSAQCADFSATAMEICIMDLRIVVERAEEGHKGAAPPASQPSHE